MFKVRNTPKVFPIFKLQLQIAHQGRLLDTDKDIPYDSPGRLKYCIFLHKSCLMGKLITIFSLRHDYLFLTKTDGLYPVENLSFQVTNGK